MTQGRSKGGLVVDSGPPAKVALGPGRTAPYLAAFLGLSPVLDA